MDYQMIVQISKLQRVQYAAARVITDIPKFSHITPAFYELRWLPITYIVTYQV